MEPLRILIVSSETELRLRGVKCLRSARGPLPPPAAKSAIDPVVAKLRVLKSKVLIVRNGRGSINDRSRGDPERLFRRWGTPYSLEE
jgi:hypothetical protein